LRSTTSTSIESGSSNPASFDTGAYRGAYDTSAAMAAASVFPERDQPGQSTADAKTRLSPVSRTTARRSGFGLTRRG